MSTSKEPSLREEMTDLRVQIKALYEELIIIKSILKWQYNAEIQDESMSSALSIILGRIRPKDKHMILEVAKKGEGKGLE